MQGKTIKLGWKNVTSSLTTDLFFPATRWWQPEMLFGAARSTMEMRGRFGGALVVPAYQTCNDELSPDAAVAIPILNNPGGGYANADGVYFPALALATLSIADKRKIRLGWMVKLASAGNGGADVSAEIDLFY